MRSSSPLGVATPVEPLVAALSARLGSGLEAVLLLEGHTFYPHAQPPAEAQLFIIVSPVTGLAKVRDALRPPLRASEETRFAIVVATQVEFSRHLQLEPFLASLLDRAGKPVFGQYSLPAAYGKLPGARLARLANATLHYSALLAPDLLPVHEVDSMRAGLLELHQSVTGRAAAPDADPGVMLSQIQGVIFPQASQHIQADFRAPPADQQPVWLPGLAAIYERQHSLILVLQDDDLGAIVSGIARTDWHGVGDRLAGHYRALHLTTAAQLQLIASLDEAADYFLGNYSHVWGAEVLADLNVEQRAILRNLGRWPSQLALAELPQLFVQAASDEFFMLIHDLQNKLLNVQLRNELYCRRMGQKPQTPPITLPEPTVAVESRLEAIQAHLLGWADHYRELARSDGNR